MSRSIPNTGTQNPATKFFDWNARKGQLEYYDKTTKENVAVALPFRFLVLDQVATVTGGIKRQVGGGKKKYDGYWSNAVRPQDLKTRPFIVKSKIGGKEGEGLWADIKNSIRGVKYMTGLYIAFREGDSLQIGYLKIKGSVLTEWIEFNKDRRNIESGAFTITGKSEPIEGENDDIYFTPVFSFTEEVKPETETQAVALDAQLQVYLKSYFAQAADTSEPEYGDAYEPPFDNRPDANDGYRSLNDNDLANEPEGVDESDEPF